MFICGRRIIQYGLLNIKCVSCFNIQFCLKNFSFQEELGEILSYVYACIHVTYRLFLSDINNIWIISKKSSNIKFYKNPSSGSTNGRTDRQIDMTQLIIVVRSSKKAPKKIYIKSTILIASSAIKSTGQKTIPLDEEFVKSNTSADCLANALRAGLSGVESR
jgi:hypothetical protein